MFNPLQIMQMFNQLKSNQNPMQLMQQLMGNDPRFQRAVEMMNGRTPEEMEQVLKNVCQQQGLDYNQLKAMLPIKF